MKLCKPPLKSSTSSMITKDTVQSTEFGTTWRTLAQETDSRTASMTIFWLLMERRTSSKLEWSSKTCSHSLWNLTSELMKNCSVLLINLEKTTVQLSHILLTSITDLRLENNMNTESSNYLLHQQSLLENSSENTN